MAPAPRSLHREKTAGDAGATRRDLKFAPGRMPRLTTAFITVRCTDGVRRTVIASATFQPEDTRPGKRMTDMAAAPDPARLAGTKVPGQIEALRIKRPAPSPRASSAIDGSVSELPSHAAFARRVLHCDCGGPLGAEDIRSVKVDPQTKLGELVTLLFLRKAQKAPSRRDAPGNRYCLLD